MQQPTPPVFIAHPPKGPLNVPTNGLKNNLIDPNWNISDRPHFLTPGSALSKGAVETPDGIRDSIYYPQKSPPDVGGQINPGLNTLLKRDEIYNQSADGNRHGPAPTSIPEKYDLQKSAITPTFTPFSLQENRKDADLSQNLYNAGPISIIQGGKYALTEGFVGPLRNFDIFAIAHWLRNVGSEVYFLPKHTTKPNDTSHSSFEGPVRSTYPGGPNGAETLRKSITWLASNFLLASLNKGDTQAYGPLNLLWNPLSFASALLPARGLLPTERPTIGNMVSTYKDNLATSVKAGDAPIVGERLLIMRKGGYSEISPVKRLSQLLSPIGPPSYVGDINGSQDGGDNIDTADKRGGIPSKISIIAGQLGEIPALEKAATIQGLHTNLYTIERPYNASNAAYPLETLEKDYMNGLDKVFGPDLKTAKLFDAKPFPGSGLGSSGKDLTWVAKFPELQGRGVNLQDTPDNVDVGFGVLDAQDGQVDQVIPDDENYMPFMFQDLRDENDAFLYLRAFIKEGFSETFTPEWKEDRYYGRTEAVPIYMGTMRTINLSFDMVAWSPKDLPVLFMKLQKLQSMVYPLFDEKGFLKSGPIIRMRIGDLIAAENGQGLPGYITSMDLSYDKSIWNIKKDFKVPRNLTVSLSFTVLHDTNPGLYKNEAGDVKFGTASVEKDGDTFKVKKISEANIRKIFRTGT